jgi:hypothetical protein
MLLLHWVLHLLDLIPFSTTYVQVTILKATAGRDRIAFSSASMYQGILLYDWDGRILYKKRGQVQTLGIESVN